jgi:cobalt-precorrin-7 (C5)-methyltransferase
MVIASGHGITIVGCGPGGPDYLTPAANMAIKDAEVLAGAPRLLELFPGVGQQHIAVGGDIPGALDEIATVVRERNVIVLVSGDPGICSLAQPVLRRFGRDACRIVPGISSIQVAFARLGLDWTDARIMSAHHHAPDFNPKSLAHESKLAILAGNSSTMPWVRKLAHTLSDTHVIFICEDLTLPQEQVRQIASEELVETTLSPQSILLFIGNELWK